MTYYYKFILMINSFLPTICNLQPAIIQGLLQYKPILFSVKFFGIH